MIDCKNFYEILKESGLEFYSGVPDSLLKNFCYFVDDSLDPSKHIIAPNEGAAIALASGYHLSTGRIPVVYLQNSGLGNTVNPLLSLADPDVYSIPLLLVIGWRGEPGIKDEPQHVKQGRVMIDMLESMGILYDIVDSETDVPSTVKKAVEIMISQKRPYVFAVREGSFANYTPQKKSSNSYSLKREEVINELLFHVQKEDVVVCTTGKSSRELYELRIKRDELGRADFLTVGSMGHSSQIALGVALQKPDKKVFCIDGDGAVIMHMGSFTTVGRLSPKNFVHVMINNGAHESVGGQETGAFDINWPSIALACGYKSAQKMEKIEELKTISSTIKDKEGPHFFEIRTSQGSRSDLGRPKSSPIDNKNQFMEALKR